MLPKLSLEKIYQTILPNMAKPFAWLIIVVWQCLAWILYPWLAFHNKKHCQVTGLPSQRQRRGFDMPSIGSKNTIWIHCCSLGESLAYYEISPMLQQRYRQFHWIYSTTTVSGYQILKKLFPDATVVWAPWDAPLWTARWFRWAKPSMILLFEAEIWPGWIGHASAYQIPIYLLNGRMSQQAAKQYARWYYWIAPSFAALTGIAAVSLADVKRFCFLGADKKKTTMVGNCKWLKKAPLITADLIQIAPYHDTLEVIKDRSKRFIWLSASTHPGEEDLLLPLIKPIRQVHPHALLILAPRHIDRIDALIDLCEKYNLTWQKRSNPSQIALETEVLLLDTFGELAKIYAVASAVWVGGSFVNHGGQNPIEPLVAGARVAIGPCYFNFQAIVESLRLYQCLEIVQDADALLAWLIADTQVSNHTAFDSMQGMIHDHWTRYLNEQMLLSGQSGFR